MLYLLRQKRWLSELSRLPLDVVFLQDALQVREAIEAIEYFPSSLRVGNDALVSIVLQSARR